MEAYTAFADIYNEFMDNIPYDNWCGNIVDILNEHGITDGTIVELGCGTGNMTRLLASSGYNMLGVDLSEDMLVNAMAEDDGSEILYLHQDMRELELGGMINAAVSVCDSMNYILTEEDLVKVFERVGRYLVENGIFLFDMKTLHFYKDVLGDTVITDNREDSAIIWENEFDEASALNTYYITMFMAVSDDEDSLFERYQEEHIQRAYSIDEVKNAIEVSGLELISIMDAESMKEQEFDSERLYYVVQKKNFSRRHIDG